MAEKSEFMINNLKDLTTRRSGASSFDEWVGDWDPTEELAVAYISRLRSQVALLESLLAEARKAIPESHMVLRLRNAIAPAAVKDANPALAGWYEWLSNWATAIDAAGALRAKPEQPLPPAESGDADTVPFMGGRD